MMGFYLDPGAWYPLRLISEAAAAIISILRSGEKPRGLAGVCSFRVLGHRPLDEAFGEIRCCSAGSRDPELDYFFDFFEDIHYR